MLGKRENFLVHQASDSLDTVLKLAVSQAVLSLISEELHVGRRHNVLGSQTLSSNL